MGTTKRIAPKRREEECITARKMKGKKDAMALASRAHDCQPGENSLEKANRKSSL
jgi:hypothetical protein